MLLLSELKAFEIWAIAEHLSEKHFNSTEMIKEQSVNVISQISGYKH
jgi:hypothetical protein